MKGEFFPSFSFLFFFFCRMEEESLIFRDTIIFLFWIEIIIKIARMLILYSKLYRRKIKEIDF